MPSLEPKLKNEPPSTGVRLALNPALARGMPGVAGPVPGANRQSIVPVKA
jgi:hypothetical protein